MKKNMATAMAAAMAFGAVVPAFANEVTTMSNATKTVDTATAEGKIAKVYSYEQVYNTNFTPNDKSDDTLKAGYTILDVFKDGNEVKYLASRKATSEELSKKDIEDAKIELEDAKNEIKVALTKKYTDTKGNVKSLYTKTEELVEIEDVSGKTHNEYRVVLTNNNGGDDLLFIFKNVLVENDEVDTVVDTTIVDLVNYEASAYKNLRKYVYELEKNAAKITVQKVEKDPQTLVLNIYKNGDKKVLVHKLEIKGFHKFDKDKLKAIPGKNDFSSHWAEENIYNAMEKGQVDVSAAFRPDASITRAEFAKIMIEVLDIPLSSIGIGSGASENFSDVDKTDWHYKYVITLVEHNLIKGYNDGTFRPDAVITRQEAALMLAQAAKYRDTLADGNTTQNNLNVTIDATVNVNGKPVHKDIITSFKDDATIADWSDEAVKSLSDLGIIKGYQDNTFRAENKITRAETIVMVERALAEVVK